MFESIRNHQRILQLILVILIFPAFAFFGLPAYDRMTGGDSIASVDGNPITMQEFEQAQREQMDRLRQSLGDSFDPALLQSEAAQREILEGLIVRHVLFWAAREENISVTDEELRRTITPSRISRCAASDWSSAGSKESPSDWRSRSICSRCACSNSCIVMGLPSTEAIESPPVTLVGFGTFAVGKRAARSGRNPRTGETIKIKAAKLPKFRPGKALKDAIN